MTEVENIIEEGAEEVEDLTKEEEPKDFNDRITLENTFNYPVINSPTITGGAKLNLGSGNKCFKFEADKGIWLGNADYDSAPFKVDIDGNVTGSSATFSQYFHKTNDNIDDVPAGNWTSKAITLAVADGSGDSKIQAGKTDFTNDDSGFILGIDDSDSNTPKFLIGNSTHYLNWTTTLDITGSRRLEVHTAGEDIADGDLVCIKGEVRTFSPTEDAWVSESAPTTNYGTDTINYVQDNYSTGSGTRKRTLLQFDISSLPSASYIYKAILHLNVNTTGADTYPELRELDADFNESTVTWNTQPTSTTIIETEYLDDGKHLTASTGADTFDVTQFIRHGKYGICITLSTDGAGTNYHTYSKEHATTSYRPYLEVILLSNSDEKVYKAQADDFQNYRAIIGVAQGAISKDANGLIQVDGIIENITDSNESRLLYLSYLTAGSIGAREAGGQDVRVGRTIGTNKIKLDIQKNDLYIQKLEGLPYGNMDINDEKTIYIPEECRKVVLNGSGGYMTSEYYGDLNRITENDTFRITWGAGADTITIKNISGADNKTITSLWFYT